MSRNAHFSLLGNLGTSYAPDAEGSAEGDILGVSAYDLSGLREDDAAVRMGVSAYDLAGLREDDAAVRMGVSAYDLAGLREDDAAVRLGVSAYDLAGLREDDAAVRLGLTDFDGATGSAEGSAAGHRVAQMGGVLVSNGRIGGMVEDHYDIQLGVSAYDLAGLREDDAEVRMGVSAYDLAGLREDDAAVRMGDSRYGARYGSQYRLLRYKGEYGSEYTRLPGRRLAKGKAKRRMADVDSMSAEAMAIEQHGKVAGITNTFRMGYILRGLREDDASIRMGVSAYDLAGLREDDAAVRLGTAYEEDATGSAEDSRLGVSAYDLGRRRAYQYSVDGAEVNPPAMLAADGFHERFPVRLMKGLGRINLGNIAWMEAMPRIQTALSQEAKLYERVLRLNDVSKAAIMTQVANLNAMDHGQLFKGSLQMYLNGGEAHWLAHEGTQRRLFATEKIIPTVDAMLTAYERGATPDEALKAALANVDKRIDDLKSGFMQYALPIGGGLAVAGVITALVVSASK